MRLRLISILCLVTFALVACQTIQGAGRDIQSAGRSLERAVR